MPRVRCELVPASKYRALQHVRELQRLLGKNTLENEVLRDALELAHRLDRPHKGNDRIEIQGVILGYQL